MGLTLLFIGSIVWWLGRVPNSHWIGLWGRTREREWVTS